eukprot:CAMPEP_0203666328 /NCGR_PEP_ID=MMETSP0090-20130426/3382_1 /ASSEMBLY_ACC=CAM_ASM_001088 /TAXON_ID=426623 /ORGANISM="Chaetoceros affinis, Strain CCMP159" /LENGTH=640 /DNA_ID=CAMNT_0050530175 /DNA_START=163 /DNA_END=2082 /DNA_ORIENTATION=+
MTDNTFTTEIVRGLFGPNISTIQSAYKCSHQRASGRLYIAPNALCFYSNIFGFERKLMIRMADVTFAGLTRSTSIIIRSKCSGSGNRNRNSIGHGHGHGHGHGNRGEDVGVGVGGAGTNSGRVAESNNENSTSTSSHHRDPHVHSFFEEEHVFKSFDEREVVLREILNLIEKANSMVNENVTGISISTETSGGDGSTSTCTSSFLNGITTSTTSTSNQNLNNNQVGAGGAPLMSMKRFEVPSFMMNMSKRGILNRNEKSMNNSYEDNSSMRSLRLRTYSDPRDHDINTRRRLGSASSAASAAGIATTATATAGSTNSFTNRIRVGSTPDWRKHKDFNFSFSTPKSLSPPMSKRNSRNNLASSKLHDSTASLEPEHLHTHVHPHVHPQQQQPQSEEKEQHIVQNNNKQIIAFNQRKVDFERNYPKLITDSFMLPNYTLDEFYTKFLDDDAPCSLEVFQRTVIKDENIQLSPWNKVSPFTTPSSPSSSTNTDDIEETMTRTLSFLHLRKSSKIGPSTAQTTRQQICSKFGPSGVVLHTTTKLDGVPYSDCFLVEEEWIIEPLQREEGGGGIQLSVRLKVTFVKSTVMKKIISKQSKEEVKKWYNLYLPYLSSGDKLTDNIEVDRQDENIRENVDVSLDYHPW